jgi:hypothetical protein
MILERTLVSEGINIQYKEYYNPAPKTYNKCCILK